MVEPCALSKVDGKRATSAEAKFRLARQMPVRLAKQLAGDVADYRRVVGHGHRLSGKGTGRRRIQTVLLSRETVTRQPGPIGLTILVSQAPSGSSNGSSRVAICSMTSRNMA